MTEEQNNNNTEKKDASPATSVADTKKIEVGKTSAVATSAEKDLNKPTQTVSTGASAVSATKEPATSSVSNAALNASEAAQEPQKLTVLGLFNPAKGRASLMRLLVLIGIIAVIVAIAVSPALQPKPAALVNGQRIEEKTITDYIVDYRNKQELTSEEDWGKFLANNNKTVEEFRSDIIDYFVQRELIRQGAAEKGVEVDSSSVDELYNSVRSQFSDDQTWTDALTEAGLTEQSYRKELEFVSMQQKLGEKLRQEKDDLSELEQTELDSAKEYKDQLNGAKKSSHILFNTDDEATAQSVLDQIKAGTLSFEDAVQQYSTDEASKADGGNVGWDKQNSFIEAYTNALANLQKDQVSDLVKSDYGVHIIKCTDVWNAPDEITSLDQIPEDLREDIVKNAEQQYDYQLLNEWVTEKKEGSDIQKSDMPEGLSYYVDVEKYKNSESNSSDSSSSSTDAENAGSSAESTTEGDGSVSDTGEQAIADSTSSENAVPESTDATTETAQ